MGARPKKIAIAAVILVVGTGAALLFRREEAEKRHTIANSTAPQIATSANRLGTPAAPSSEPKLAGRIEPPAAAADIAERPAATGEGDARKRSEASLAASQSGSAAGASGSIDQWSVPEFPASLLPAASEPISRADSPLKWQTVRRPSTAAPPAAPEQGSPFERFTSEPPNTRQRAVERRHRIVDGDSLAALAHRYLGSQARHLDLYEYNRDVLASPEILPIGKELRIPPAGYLRPEASPRQEPSSALVAVTQTAAAPRDVGPLSNPGPAQSQPATPRTAKQTYVVQPHDTLALISRKLYGDVARQAELVSANREQLRSAKDLRPGMTLVVPQPSRGQPR